MNTRIRVSTIPARVTSAAAASLRGVFAPLASSTAPITAEPALADLGLPRLSFTITARRIRGVPLTVPAGRYHLTVVDDRQLEAMPGAVMLMQLPTGMTLDRAMASADEALDAPPRFFYESIMPGGIAVDEDGIGVSVVDLVPGEWIVAGYAMTTEPTTMTVTGEIPAALPEPHADAIVTVSDAAVGLDAGAFQKGQNIVRIDNTGTRPHFVSIHRVATGTAGAGIGTPFHTKGTQEHHPTSIDIANMVHIATSVDQSAGTTMWLSLDLEPGVYAILGDISRPTDGAVSPHAGMYSFFTIA